MASDRAGWVIVAGIALMVGCAYLLSGPIFSLLYAMGASQYFTISELSTLTSGEIPARVTFLILASSLVNAGFYVGIGLTILGIYMEAQPAQRFLPPPPPTGLCPKCGAMNPPTSKFCNECATKL